ncbi:MAG TPA: addiction module protein [Thermoanaerobaculia bacterium]|nr:addiction module protein [Thermoanaerobaculia bacterium]
MNAELLNEAKRLSVDERIQLVTAIWDSVAEDAPLDALPLSEAHRVELDHRLEDQRRNPGDESPWDEVAERLRRR